jgi:hypothetical protein
MLPFSPSCVPASTANFDILLYMLGFVMHSDLLDASYVGCISATLQLVGNA